MLKKIQDVGSNIGDGLSDAGEVIGSGAKSLGGAAVDGIDNMLTSPNIGEALSKLKDNPALMAMLLGGTGAGIAGGFAESKRKGHEGETGEERRERILRNALLFGGGGAAAAGLAGLAHKSFSTALPEGDRDPASSVLKPALRVAGGGTVGAGLYTKGLRTERAHRDSVLGGYVKSLKEQAKKPNNPHSDELASEAGKVKEYLGRKGTNFGRQSTFDDITNAHNHISNPTDYGRAPNRYDDVSAIRKAIASRDGSIMDVAGRLDPANGKTVLKRHLRRLLGNSKTSKGLAGAALAAGILTPEIIGMGAHGAREVAM